MVSTVELALDTCLGHLQQRVAYTWKGREKQALFSIVRVLDSEATFAYRGAHPSADKTRLPRQEIVFQGVAAALRPFLAAMKHEGGGIPFAKDDANVYRYFYAYLHDSGALTSLRRLAGLERFGLASSEQVSADHFRISVSPGGPELASRLAAKKLSRSTTQSARSQQRWNRLHNRMQSYVESVDGWFIRYDNDSGIVKTYRDEARLYGLAYSEREAHAAETIIGDRRFDAWKDMCDQALGRVLTHIDFATLLQKKAPEIEMENILTIWARQEDIAAVWMQAGMKADQVPATMRALTLSIDTLDDWEHAFEVPTPFYIDIGRGFFLLPCFGALLNPYSAFFRHLRQTYRSDWDSGVGRREAIFRKDLVKVFATPRFIVPECGFLVRRSDGSSLTDIDALIVDKESGELALVQLKWHDIYGYSLSERESRRRNILKANEWIERVLSWVDGRSSHEILTNLGLNLGKEIRSCAEPPQIYVIARYIARFAGDGIADPRAHWMSWPEIQLASKEVSGASALRSIPRWIISHQKKFERHEILEVDYRFPNLDISLRLPVSTELEEPQRSD